MTPFEFRSKFRPKYVEDSLKKEESEAKLRSKAKDWYRDFVIRKAKDKFIPNQKTDFNFGATQFYFRNVNALQGFVPGQIYTFLYKINEEDIATKQDFLMGDLGPVWFHIKTDIEKNTIAGVNFLNIPNPKDKIDFLDFIFQKYEKLLFENYVKGAKEADIKKQKPLPVLESMIRAYPKYQIPIKVIRLQGISTIPKIYSISDWVFTTYAPANMLKIPQ